MEVGGWSKMSKIMSTWFSNDPLLKTVVRTGAIAPVDFETKGQVATMDLKICIVYK